MVICDWQCLEKSFCFDAYMMYSKQSSIFVAGS